MTATLQIDRYPRKSVRTDDFIKVWARRYVPDLSRLTGGDRLTVGQLSKFVSAQERKKTTTHLQRLLKINCECAGLKTDALYSYIPNVINLSESRRIARFVEQVYLQVLDLYQQHPFTSHSSSELDVAAKVSDVAQQVFIDWALLTPDRLAVQLEPVLKILRQQHLLSKDPRSIGFLTTHFHFSTELILKRLTLAEQVLLSPYFKFVEEQVCIPWQRIHRAAKYAQGLPSLTAVQQITEASQSIACAVHNKAVQQFPGQTSRRGDLSHSGVTSSTLRDLQMFQGYLCLCMLEKHIDSIEYELLPLSVMVFPSVDVSWNLVEGMLQILMDEILEKVDSKYRLLVEPYAHAIQALFADTEKRQSLLQQFSMTEALS